MARKYIRKEDKKVNYDSNDYKVGHENGVQKGESKSNSIRVLNNSLIIKNKKLNTEVLNLEKLVLGSKGTIRLMLKDYSELNDNYVKNKNINKDLKLQITKFKSNVLELRTENTSYDTLVKKYEGMLNNNNEESVKHFYKHNKLLNKFIASLVVILVMGIYIVLKFILV